MKTLQQFLILNLNESDLSTLPEPVMDEIRKNIRAGAKDIDQKWANALELTHRAYYVAGIQRPTPDLKEAWKQYEQNLEFAVQQLSKTRGLDGDWRMSSAVFREALERLYKYRVTVYSFGTSMSYNTEAHSLTELLEYIQNHDNSTYDMKVKRSPDNTSATILFYRFGVKVKARIDIQQTGVTGGSII